VHGILGKLWQVNQNPRSHTKMKHVDALVRKSDLNCSANVSMLEIVKMMRHSRDMGIVMVYISPHQYNQCPHRATWYR
jgi:hypothetical protein